MPKICFWLPRLPAGQRSLGSAWEGRGTTVLWGLSQAPARGPGPAGLSRTPVLLTSSGAPQRWGPSTPDSCSHLPGVWCACRAPRLDEQMRTSPSRVGKAGFAGALLLGGDFGGTCDRNKQENPPTGGNSVCQVTSETGLFLPQQGSHPDRKLARLLAPRLMAPPLAPPHGRLRPPPGMLSGPGRAGPAGLRGGQRLPAPACPADATSLAEARSREVTCWSCFRGASGRPRPGEPDAPSAAEWREGGRADVYCCGGRARRLGAGPARPAGRPGRGGRCADFCPSWVPSLWAGPLRRPRPSPARSREMFIWAVAWGAGGWWRGVSGPRSVARRGRDKMSARAAAAKVSAARGVPSLPAKGVLPGAALLPLPAAGAGPGPGRGQVHRGGVAARLGL